MVGTCPSPGLAATEETAVHCVVKGQMRAQQVRFCQGTVGTCQPNGAVSPGGQGHRETRGGGTRDGLGRSHRDRRTGSRRQRIVIGSSRPTFPEARLSNVPQPIDELTVCTSPVLLCLGGSSHRSQRPRGAETFWLETSGASGRSRCG